MARTSRLPLGSRWNPALWNAWDRLGVAGRLESEARYEANRTKEGLSRIRGEISRACGGHRHLLYNKNHAR